ncbi:BolA/IbaG family iron-sulfur metabolism protein [Porticoccus sp.]|jgi:acid stress-induced BolA-like protein IbaG/YrbA|nr:BolA/IbaG family iron-sulfur metabolism protein [Gammaproteobacteria bacterium]MDA7737727.1 BolA/IbaG family iron-sulfur metabolism protein [Porticoccus sp.]MDC1270506.1 BolA/IbaG family iron-sulfur metabolism protein [Porticoccus sp.]
MDVPIILEIQDLLNKKLPNCNIKVEGSNGHFDINVTGEIFLGLNSVKRQQLVYQIINEYIKNGTIHAVSIKASTGDEL